MWLLFQLYCCRIILVASVTASIYLAVTERADIAGHSWWLCWNFCKIWGPAVWCYLKICMASLTAKLFISLKRCDGCYPQKLLNISTVLLFSHYAITSILLSNLWTQNFLKEFANLMSPIESFLELQSLMWGRRHATLLSSITGPLFPSGQEIDNPAKDRRRYVKLSYVIQE